MERLIILLVPLLFLLAPTVQFLLMLFRSLVRRRIHRLYGELKFLTRAPRASDAPHAISPPKCGVAHQSLSCHSRRPCVSVRTREDCRLGTTGSNRCPIN